ncbi:MAG: SDR family oxidoreductase [Planctomycetes bacterium]|nr:SDR family oxidoreductase [Planctomycetota bacterium]
MIDLKGHAALITGGTKGVGAAIAKAMSAAGARIVIQGRHDNDEARAALDACSRNGADARLILGDLAGPTEACVDGVVEAAIAADPEIDILVSNAGTYDERPFLEIDHATFERTMRLNVFSHFFMAQRFARRWRVAGTRGRILLIGSINGRLAEPNHAAYDTSKGAIDAMVRTLCVALAPFGIRVNGLAPGLVETPLTAPALRQASFRRWMELHTPNGQVPPADVCGPGAVFLVSDAAEHVHGQMLLVDGGMSVWQQPDPPSSYG